MNKLKEYLINGEYTEEGRKLHLLLCMIESQYKTLLKIWNYTDDKKTKELIYAKLEEYQNLIDIIEEDK